MMIKTVTLALAATGIAAGLYMKRRRSHQVTTKGIFPPQSDASPDPLDMAAGMAGAGLESPNAAERLQAGRFAGSTRDDGAFSSSSQGGSQPASPGLGDFTRGA